jgi:hypothetical protein
VLVRSLISAAALLAFSSFTPPGRAEESASSTTRPPAAAIAGSSPQPADSLQPPTAAVRTRILIVYQPAAARSRDEFTRLNATGGSLELLRKRGWQIGSEPTGHIQFVDRSSPIETDLQSVVAQLPVSEGVIVVSVEAGQIVRSFKSGCTTPLDQWTFGWLMTGNDDRPVDFTPEPVKVATTGNYRLRGNHWSIEGDWNPTRESVARHLRASHPGSIQAGWSIESWSLEELRSLHDDIHDREEGFRGRYAQSSTTTSRSTGGSGLRKPGSTR